MVTVVQDTVAFERTARWKVVLGFCLLSWIVGLVYATDAGLNFLDIIDFYINFVMLAVGFFETFGAGWVYNSQRIKDMVGQAAFFTYAFANFGSLLIACGIWFGIANVWAGFVALILIYLFSVGATLMLLKMKVAEDPDKYSFEELVWAVTFKNIFDLKNRIEPTIGYVPSIWCILVKQFIPHVLVILFINLAQSNTDDGTPLFGGYGGYPAKPYQILGILTFCFAIFLFMIGMAFPVVYKALALPEGHPSLEEEETLHPSKVNESESASDVQADEVEAGVAPDSSSAPADEKPSSTTVDA
jgi:hypothetical protein